MAICIKPLIINIDFSVETNDHFSLLMALGLRQPDPFQKIEWKQNTEYLASELFFSTHKRRKYNSRKAGRHHIQSKHFQLFSNVLLVAISFFQCQMNQLSFYLNRKRNVCSNISCSSKWVLPRIFSVYLDFPKIKCSISFCYFFRILLLDTCKYLFGVSCKA